MIPWLLMAELISTSGTSLGGLIADLFKKFPSSGERNFTVADPDNVIAAILQKYGEAAELDEMDGVSLSFPAWRFNLRKSNTEPLLRLNVEARGGQADLEQKIDDLKRLIECSWARETISQQKNASTYVVKSARGIRTPKRYAQRILDTQLQGQNYARLPS